MTVSISRNSTFFFPLFLIFIQCIPTASSQTQTVRDFGAVGDGVNDDTTAIQQAVDSGIGEIQFPRGVYRITKPIIIELDRVGPVSVIAEGTAKLIMEGAGPTLKWIGTHEGTASPTTVKDNVWQRQRTPMVVGLEIEGKHPEAVGISAEGTMQMVFTRITVRQALHGIHLVKRNRNVIISDCHLYENNGVGVYLDGVNLHQINITNCHISYNKGGGIVVRESEVRNLQIGICDIEGNMDSDGPPTANVLLDTTVGSVREGSIVGCTIQHTHNAPDSANIRFIGRSKEEPMKVGNFAIADNVMSDVAVNVHLKYARGVVISGNTFWKGFQHNFLAEDSSNIVIGPNLFDRNPDYRPPDSSNTILFRNCSDCTLTGIHLTNTLDGKAGLTLTDCQQFNISNCTILDCAQGGMVLEDVQSTRISDCLIDDQNKGEAKTYSIKMSGGQNNFITDNLLGIPLDVAEGSAVVKENCMIKQ